MGPLLVLVSPCFRENVVFTCKIVFVCVCVGGVCVCSLDTLLQKNVIVFFFGYQISKWRSFEKRAIFGLLSHFLVTREKLQKFLQHVSHSHTTHMLLTLLTFLPCQLWKKHEFIRYGFSLVWFLVLIFIHAILEQSINNKMVSKT